jgi:hypothetical protein
MNMTIFATFNTSDEAIAAGRVWLKSSIHAEIKPLSAVVIDQDAIQPLDLHEIRKIKARALAAARRAKR